MPHDGTDFAALLRWQQKIKEADTFAAVHQLAEQFGKDQLGVETAVLSITAVPDLPSTDFALHLPVGFTGYWLSVSREADFSDSERGLAETAVALLSTAPYFRPIIDPQRSRLLEVVYAVAETVRGLGPLDPLLKQVNHQLLTAFSVSSAFIAILQPNSDQITFACITIAGESINCAPVSLMDTESLVSWVIVNGLPYITGNWSEDQKPALHLVGDAQVSSVIYVPMFYGDDVLGALAVMGEAQNAFTEEDFVILQAVASHVATAVNNSRLYNHTKTLVEKSTRDYQVAVALRQSISVISSTLEKDAVIKHLFLALDNLLAYNVAHLFLCEKEQFKLAASHDKEGRPLDLAPKDIESVWRRNPLLHQIHQEKESIFLNNPSDHPGWPLGYGAGQIQSWLGTPLIAGGGVLGVLMVQSDQANAFGKQQQWLAATISAHTSVALQNADLYQKTQQQLNELSTLYQASATMSANLDQEFVLQSVVAEMVRALKVDSCTIFVWDRGRDYLIPAAHSNFAQTTTHIGDPQKSPEVIGLGTISHLERNEIIQYVFETRTIYSLRSDNAHTPERRALLETSGLKAILLVPLIRGNDVLGLLALGQQTELRLFTDGERRLAQNLASQAAIAIEHAHLFAQAQRRVEELATFHNIVLQLNTPLKQSTVLDAITESALKLVDATNLHIYLYDQKTGEYTFGSARWRDGCREPAVTNIRPNGLTATVVNRAEPVIINNAKEHPLFQSETAKAWGIEAIAGFPLKRGDEVIGAFTITYLHPHKFNEDEILLLNLLADQAAVAVRNARLYADSQRRLRDMSALVDMAQRITGKLKIRSVLQTTVQILQGLLNARASTITMLSEDRTELVVAAAVGVKSEYTQARMKLDDSISGQVVRNGQLVYIRDTYAEPAFLFFSEIVRSLMVVPLIVRGETIGTLTIDSDRPNAFSESDIQLMTIAAAQVSIAISNAGLFEEVEARAAELAVAYEELKESDRLKDELVQNVSHELRTPLTFVKGYVDLLMDGEMGLVSPKQLDALQIVATKTDEITRLIDDIITLQRIDAGNLELESHSLADMIRTAIASHSIVAEKKDLVVQSRLPDQVSKVLMDKGRINQVLDNLIANAMKFSPDGGVITIILEENAQELTVTISDQGIGMLKEKQARIFDRFYQIDGSSRRRFGGTGIGLAIVKRIVDAHHGKIWVESELHQGSSFFFTLPKTNAAILDEELADASRSI